MRAITSLLDGNEREIQRLRRIVGVINGYEAGLEALSDEPLRAKTDAFRDRLAAGETLDALLPEVFAVVREAAKRALGQRHFDVQMLGGIVLHQGRIAEMATGEGKTLVSTLPVTLNALSGKGVHVVTANDYLARRDAVWNGPVYHLLGLSVACLQSSPEGAAFVYAPGVAPDSSPGPLRAITRAEAYRCDILYGTNAQFGFDYLRDNMAYLPDQVVQREPHYALVDEVDSILLDEARTPLILAGQPEPSTGLYERVDGVVARLRAEADYTVDEKVRTATLTDEGVRRVEEALGIANLAEEPALMHHVGAALKARFVYKADVDYVVKEGQVIIVDESTGRLMFGRRYSEGLHQAIEAKEGVTIEAETQTVASITLQNYFRLYPRLAGMTGTAKTEEAEFRKIYALDVVCIPTHRPVQRRDLPDVIYKTEEAKFRGITQEILQLHVRQQPVLVGTRSIATSERLSQRLAAEQLQLLALTLLLRHRLDNTGGRDRGWEQECHGLLNMKLADLSLSRLASPAQALGLGVSPLAPANIQELVRLLGVQEGHEKLVEALERGIPHSILNARYHEKEAEIIAGAGKKGAVTIATNMAGRGVDILLGGRAGEGVSPSPADQEAVRRLGGLAIIGSERHESRRIDRQLRGRSGRQGEPGQSRFYLSLEDELWRLFGEKENRVLGGWREDQPLEAKLLTAAIERAQKKVEARHFGMRKQTLEYDDVMNVQRGLIYRQRRQVLEGANLRETILAQMRERVLAAVERHCSREAPSEAWDEARLVQELESLFTLSATHRVELRTKSREELVELLVQAGEERYATKEREIAETGADIRDLERQVTLQLIDQKWLEHLNAMEYLREGIYLRAYAQQDPLIAYKKETYEMFQALQGSLQDDVVEWMYHVRLVRQPPRRIINPLVLEPGENGHAALEGASHKAEPLSRGAIRKKGGRNDPCPCGSGKKLKRCCQGRPRVIGCWGAPEKPPSA